MGSTCQKVHEDAGHSGTLAAYRPIPLSMRNDASAEVAGRLSRSRILFTVVCESPERSLPEICDFTIFQGKDVNSSGHHR